MKHSKITRNNPETLYPPVGNYTHITRIPRNAELFVASGQIGIDEGGSLPDTMNEQIQNTFNHIRTLLHSEGLTPKDIIKVNIWAVEPIDWEFLNARWAEMFGSEYPAMTVGYITRLGWPEIKIEIEIWAAKA